jgi:hypothetical protein
MTESRLEEVDCCGCFRRLLVVASGAAWHMIAIQRKRAAANTPPHILWELMDDSNLAMVN